MEDALAALMDEDELDRLMDGGALAIQAAPPASAIWDISLNGSPKASPRASSASSKDLGASSSFSTDPHEPPHAVPSASVSKTGARVSKGLDPPTCHAADTTLRQRTVRQVGSFPFASQVGGCHIIFGRVAE